MSSSKGSFPYERQTEVYGNGATEVEAGINGTVELCHETSIEVSAGMELSIIKDVMTASVSVTTETTESKCSNQTTRAMCKWSVPTEKNGV